MLSIFVLFICSISFVSADNILVFSAHPDDEAIGLGGKIIQSVKEGDTVRLIIMTDGAPDEYEYDWDGEAQYILVRKSETKAAMAIAAVPEENIIFLDYDDSGYIFSLGAKGMVDVIFDIATIIKDLKPDEVYVHAYEHGHIDHDTTNYIVARALEKSGIPASIFEYIEYNPAASGKPIPDDRDMIDNDLYSIEYLDMDDEELLLKKQMIVQYRSQNPNENCRKKEELPNYAFTPDNLEECDLGYGNWSECDRNLLCFYFYGKDMIRKLPDYDYTLSPCINNSCRWSATKGWPDNKFYDIVAEADAILGKDSLNSKSGFLDHLKRFFGLILLEIKSFFDSHILQA